MNRRSVFALLAVGVGVVAAAGCAGKADQGTVISTAEAQARQDAGTARIENESSLSAKNRALMLKARSASIQQAASESHPPPPPH